MTLEVLAVIPARCGSKGIQHKNISMFMGKPLLAHSIGHALDANSVNRTVVSTDSARYAAIAREYGSEVPFLRPAGLAGDSSTDLEVFQHALAWLEENQGYRPDVCVHLRPTCPIRPSGLIDRAVAMLEEKPDLDSVRTVSPMSSSPFKMWFMAENGHLVPCVQTDLVEPWNLPRQVLRPGYLQNACVDVVWSRVIREAHSMTGKRIGGLLMNDVVDIDTPGDFARIHRKAAPQLVGKRIVVDMDGVIATLTARNDYRLAEPLTDNIRVINRLAAAGNTIVVFTARGSATGLDWSELTRDQLRRWGVAHHELILGKPPADFYVDDRGVSLDDLARGLEQEATGGSDE